jgi:hypothetical protein
LATGTISVFAEERHQQNTGRPTLKEFQEKKESRPASHDADLPNKKVLLKTVVFWTIIIGDIH